MRFEKIVRDPATALIRALLTLCCGKGELEEHIGRAWASATFTGMRHEVAMRFRGSDAVEAGEAMLDALAAYEFDVRGHIVADIQAVTVTRSEVGEPRLSVRIEALTVEDA
jgi:hypothetical protein